MTAVPAEPEKPDMNSSPFSQRRKCLDLEQSNLFGHHKEQYILIDGCLLTEQLYDNKSGLEGKRSPGLHTVYVYIVILH